MARGREISEAPRDLRGLLRKIGPGAVLSGEVIGAGEAADGRVWICAKLKLHGSRHFSTFAAVLKGSPQSAARV